MSTTVRERLIRDLPKDEDLRYDYDDEFLNTYISTQIRALREARKMTQTELARAAKTGQSQISEMEGDYHSWSLRTLRKLARALGVRLFVTFEGWGELIPRVENFRRESLVRPIIEEDVIFQPAEPLPTETAANRNVTPLRDFPKKGTANIYEGPAKSDRFEGRKPKPTQLDETFRASGFNGGPPEFNGKPLIDSRLGT